jgi:hypothetical protein
MLPWRRSAFALRAGLATYEEDFITRYLVPVIYHDGLTPKTQYLLVALVIGINLLAYAPSENAPLPDLVDSLRSPHTPKYDPVGSRFGLVLPARYHFHDRLC